MAGSTDGGLRRGATWLHIEVPALTRVYAPLLDAGCLGIFVVLGRQSHDIDAGIGWFLTVAWPFAVGWLTVALALGVYTSRSRAALRLGATTSIGVGIALVLRPVGTHRATPITFVIVAYAFIVLSTAGWRLVWRAVARALSQAS